MRCKSTFSMKSAGCQLETLRMLTLNLSKTAAITGGKEETVKLFCQAWAKNIDTERGYLDKVTKKQFSQNAIIMTYDIMTYSLDRVVPMEAAVAWCTSRCLQ